MRAVRPQQADGTVIVTTEDGFDAIPVRQVGSTSFSYWRPTLLERLRVLLGGHIRLGVFGDAHPPVSLDTLN